MPVSLSEVLSERRYSLEFDGVEMFLLYHAVRCLAHDPDESIPERDLNRLESLDDKLRAAIENYSAQCSRHEGHGLSVEARHG